MSQSENTSSNLPSPEAPDPKGIKPFAGAPDANADADTSKEVSAIAKKPTPTEMIVHAHHELNEQLKSEVAFHKSECDRVRTEGKGDRDKLDTKHQTACELFKKEIDELEAKLDAKETRIEEYISRNRDLEAASRSAGCLTLSILLCNVISATVLGIAGGVPGIPEEIKVGLIVGGTVLASVVILLSGIAWHLSPQKTKNP